MNYIRLPEAHRLAMSLNYPKTSYVAFRSHVEQCLSPPDLIQLPGVKGRWLVDSDALEVFVKSIIGDKG